MRAPWRTEAIILRRTNYGEADRILQLLTPERGKVSAIAKGVRRPKSKLAGGLELFAVSDLTIMEGRGDMGTVTSARMKQFYNNLLHDYDRMQFAYEAIKAINRATETVSEPEFYYLLHDTLAFCNNLAIDWRLCELWFRLRLAHLLGYGLNIATTHGNQRLSPDKLYQFDVGDMMFVEVANGPYTGEVLKLLRLAATQTPNVLAKIRGIETPLVTALHLVRTLHA